MTNAKEMLRGMPLRVNGGGTGREELPSPQESTCWLGRIGVMHAASDRSKLPPRVAPRDYRKRQMATNPTRFANYLRGRESGSGEQAREEVKGRKATRLTA